MGSSIILKSTIIKKMKDKFGRKIDYLRLSVTDNCNLRCLYCMEEKEQEFLSSCQKLSDQEILKIVEAAAKLGIKKIRLTGGEPLVRKGLVELMGKIDAIDGIEEIYLTTNGTLMANRVAEMVQNGLKGINISLDSLKKERFKYITRMGELDDVLIFIEECLKYNLNVKVNTVLVDGLNIDEISDFVDLTFKYPIDVRFIELMPVGIGKDHRGMTTPEILTWIKKSYDITQEMGRFSNGGPATYIKVKGAKGHIGFISAVSQCFCKECNRIRVTADGFLKQCLHFKNGINLKQLIEEGISEEDFVSVIKETIYHKPEKHLFNQGQVDEESKLMNQIGG